MKASVSVRFSVNAIENNTHMNNPQPNIITNQ